MRRICKLSAKRDRNFAKKIPKNRLPKATKPFRISTGLRKSGKRPHQSHYEFSILRRARSGVAALFISRVQPYPHEKLQVCRKPLKATCSCRGRFLNTLGSAERRDFGSRFGTGLAQSRGPETIGYSSNLSSDAKGDHNSECSHGSASAITRIANRGQNSAPPAQPESLEIRLNSGRYMEITTPPTTVPRNTMMAGSMAASRSATATSTSSS